MFFKEYNYSEDMLIKVERYESENTLEDSIGKEKKRGEGIHL